MTRNNTLIPMTSSHITLERRIKIALKAAQKIIDEHIAVDSITLKDLYGDMWIFDGSEGQQFGRKFKELYESGSLTGIEMTGEYHSDNAIRYKIHG